MEENGTLRQKRRPKGDPNPQKRSPRGPGGTQLGAVGLELVRWSKHQSQLGCTDADGMRELHSPLHFSGLDWGQGLQSPEIFRPFRHIHGMGSETEAFHLGSIGHNHVLSIIVISSEMAKF